VADLRPNSVELQVLEATPKLVRDLLAWVATTATETPVDGGWSAKDALAHLVDVDDVISERIRRIVYEDRPFIHSIDPPARLQERGLREQSMSGLLETFAARRLVHLDVIRSLTLDQLARVGEHDEAGEITAANLVWQWAYHDLMHVEQIAKIMQAALLPGMGNTRRFYFAD